MSPVVLGSGHPQGFPLLPVLLCSLHPPGLLHLQGHLCCSGFVSGTSCLGVTWVVVMGFQACLHLLERLHVSYGVDTLKNKRSM